MCVASYGARIDLLYEFVGNTTHFGNKTIKINKLIAIISCKTASFVSITFALVFLPILSDFECIIDFYYL